MQKVILLTPEEYEELVQTKEVLEKRMRELEIVVNNKDALQKYIKDWLY